MNNHNTSYFLAKLHRSLTKIHLHHCHDMSKQQYKINLMQINLKSICPQIVSPLHTILHKLVLLIVIGLLISSVQSAASPAVTLIYQQNPITIYNDSMLDPQFGRPAQTFSCANVYRFTYNQTYDELKANQPYQIVIQNMPGQFNISVNSIYGHVNPSQNTTVCFEECTVQITNNCETQQSFDAILITITGIPQIFYNVICDSNIIFSPFQSGLIILVIFSVLQIIICSKFQQCNSFSNFGHYVNYFSLGIFCFVIITGQVFILINLPNSTDILSYMCMAIAMVCGVGGVLICVCQFLFWTQSKVFRNVLCAKMFQMRVMDIIGLGLGLGLVLGWYFSGKNWIISNIIYIMIFLALVKIIKFGSLRMAALAYFCVAICNIVFIVLIQKLRQVYFNNIILFLFNNPFFIFCPCINFTPNQSCSWFFITSILSAALLLCYLDRFDESRSSKIYFTVFVVCQIVCSAIWMVVSKFVPFTLPFDLINIPICMILLCFFANRRGQLTYLWNGQIFDAKHRNKPEQQHQLISSLKQHKSQSFRSQLFKIQFTNLSSGSVQSAIRNVRNEIELKGLDDSMRAYMGDKQQSIDVGGGKLEDYRHSQ